MLARLALAVLLAASACDSSSNSTGDDVAGDVDAATVGRCTSLDGRSFSSVEVQPDCGLGPDGPVPCNWSITFDASGSMYTGWMYHHSDVVESGDIGCVGSSIVLVAPDHAASYDADTDRLVWDQIEYAPQ